MLHPLKGMRFLEFLVEKKAFRFSKRELRAGIACNKCKIKFPYKGNTPLENKIF